MAVLRMGVKLMAAIAQIPCIFCQSHHLDVIDMGNDGPYAVHCSKCNSFGPEARSKIAAKKIYEEALPEDAAIANGSSEQNQATTAKNLGIAVYNALISAGSTGDELWDCSIMTHSSGGDYVDWSFHNNEVENVGAALLKELRGESIQQTAAEIKEALEQEEYDADTVNGWRDDHPDRYKLFKALCPEVMREIEKLLSPEEEACPEPA